MDFMELKMITFSVFKLINTVSYWYIYTQYDIKPRPNSGCDLDTIVHQYGYINSTLRVLHPTDDRPIYDVNLSQHRTIFWFISE